MKKRKYLNTYIISKVLTLGGGVLIVGTAGASDTNTFTYNQILVMILISLLMIVIGARLGGVKRER